MMFWDIVLNEGGITQYSESGNLVEHGSLLERQYYQRVAISLFFDRPLLGWGANGFVTYMADIGYSHVAYSHCNFTELLSTLGIIGFCLYYIIPVGVLLRAIKGFWHSQNVNFLIAIVLIGVLLFADYYMVSYELVYTQFIISTMFLLTKFGWEEIIDYDNDCYTENST